MDDFGRPDGDPTLTDDRPGPARRGRPPRRVSPFTVVGIVMLVVGLSCLGWVGYQYLGTNAVSEKAFVTERDQLRAKWDQEKKTDPKANKTQNQAQKGQQSQAQNPAQNQAQNPGHNQAQSETQTLIAGDAMALLRIPRFGAGYEIPIVNGTDLSVLSKGVGHYNSTAQPGQIGNFALAGHRVTHGQPFAKLLELTSGDQVMVETRQAVYTYVLDESPKQLTVKDTDTWVIDPVPGKPDAKPSQALITLTTCQDLFRSPDRSIGFGHLQSTRNK